MERVKLLVKATQDATARRLRSTPGYFFLIWRWSMWLYALVVITAQPKNPYYTINIVLLIVTLLQTLVGTLYAPVFQLLLPRLSPIGFLHQRSKGAMTEDEETVRGPLLFTHSPCWNIALYSLDILICGIVTYLSGPFSSAPNFGSSSPFYRYGISSAFAAAMAYRYPGGLFAALCYDLFILLGAFLPPLHTAVYQPTITDLVGSLVDTPVAAVLAAFVATLLASYTRTKRRHQASIRLQNAVRGVGETIVRAANDRQQLLQKCAQQIREGGRFQRLVVVTLARAEEEAPDQYKLSHIETRVDVEEEAASMRLPSCSDEPLMQVLHTREGLQTFVQQTLVSKDGVARLYQPFFTKHGQLQMVLGAESVRQRPFERRQCDFLDIVGTQLSIALENIRLTQQTIELAATAERGRMARDIHDGIAQLIYMLSLNAETCATQVQRIVAASDEDAELLTPLGDYLERQVKIAKQALWETRNYMLSLKPLMSGITTLTQMLTNQIHEFEVISNLPVTLEVQGIETGAANTSYGAHRQAQIGAAIFRIVQEALTNAYKHAQTPAIHVSLCYHADGIEVTICDSGRGLSTSALEEPHMYSGHGMSGMRERAAELGGTLDVTVLATGGVQVRAWLPSA